jgi:NDP-sugar pyrophosphorylase family protein
MGKKRITITIDERLLKKIDLLSESATIGKNRSNVIENILMQSLNKPLKTAIILAGGKGTRLRPLTYEIPKPLVPIKGKPILYHIIEELKRNGIENVIIAAGYKAESIMKALGNGDNFGINITYSIENRPLGTGGAVRKACELVEEFPVLVVNGDNLFHMDINSFYEFHNSLRVSSHILATIALTTVEDTTGYGVVELEGNRIKKFYEKPEKKPKSKLINAGIYIAEKELIDLVPKNRFFSIEKQLFEKLAQQNMLAGYIFNGPWYPTDTFERYELAIKKWK